jgi:inner membrane protein
MDNLTHTLTGVLLARTGLGKLSPRGVWIAAIAANIPDIDAVSIVGGGATYFTYHRWLTHAVVALPVMAMLAVLAVAAIFRQRLPWLRAWIVALVAVSSHLALDFTNPYGIRLLAPFSGAWPALDITHVIDIWIWTILLIGAIWPLLSGLVSSEIGARKGSGRGIAIAALIVLGMYDAGRHLLHDRAIQTLESRIYDGRAPRSTVAFPQNINPMRWDGWVETDRAWISVPVDLTVEFNPNPAATYWKPEPHPAIEVARREAIFQVLSRFARTPYWRVAPAEDPGVTTVELIDLRFGRNGSSGFTARASVDASGRVIGSSFHF